MADNEKNSGKSTETKSASSKKLNAKQAAAVLAISRRYNTYFNKVLRGEMKTLDQWKSYFKKNNIA